MREGINALRIFIYETLQTYIPHPTNLEVGNRVVLVLAFNFFMLLLAQKTVARIGRRNFKLGKKTRGNEK